MTKKLMATMALWGVTSFGLGAGPALANDAKVFSGNICRLAFSDNPGRVGGIYSFQIDSVNPDGSNVVAVCPIARDNTSNTNGLADLEVYYSSTDLNGGCYGMTMGKFGSSVKAVWRAFVAGGTTMDWGASLNTGQANGSYTMFCSLPEGASIHGIRADEY